MRSNDFNLNYKYMDMYSHGKLKKNLRPCNILERKNRKTRLVEWKVGEKKKEEEKKK